jgi:hypothetical protein
MDPFLVVVHNLKSASSNMLDLGSKYLIRTLNYTPAPNIIIIIRPLLLFYAEQNSINRNLAIYCLLYYNNFCFKVLSNWCEKHSFLNRSRRHDISPIVIAVPSACIHLLYISEIELRVSNLNNSSDFSRNSRTALFFLLTR